MELSICRKWRSLIPKSRMLAKIGSFSQTPRAPSWRGMTVRSFLLRKFKLLREYFKRISSSLWVPNPGSISTDDKTPIVLNEHTFCPYECASLGVKCLILKCGLSAFQTLPCKNIGKLSIILPFQRKYSQILMENHASHIFMSHSQPQRKCKRGAHFCM